MVARTRVALVFPDIGCFTILLLNYPTIKTLGVVTALTVGELLPKSLS